MNRSAILIAAATAFAIFTLTYLSAWQFLRSKVTLGHGANRIVVMHNDFSQLRALLSEYKLKHGRYPESLAELPESSGWELVDPWRRPYYYCKSNGEYKLLSLGRDGKQGGIGLDADIDSASNEYIHISPTIYQFAIEGTGSVSLSWIALIASVTGGLTLCAVSHLRIRSPVKAKWFWYLCIFVIPLATTECAIVCLILLLAGER